MLVRKTILITGASSGLGAGMAREFAKLGRDLALCARRAERLEALRTELAQSYPAQRFVVRALDVNDHEQVFAVFRALRGELGTLDRVIVNAGVAKGQPLGTGHFRANLRTVQTNMVAALAQCEAALEIFREQNAGHLVTISSMSALRGLPRNMTAYAASKAGLATLTEGIRADLLATPIRVSTLFPGYIESEMTSGKSAPFMASSEAGCRALVRAIERESTEAYVPAWPWALAAVFMRRLPLRLLAKAI